MTEPTASPMQTLFEPPGYPWQRLSSRYASLLRLTSVILFGTLSTVPALLVGLISGQWWISAIIWGAGAAFALLRIWLSGRMCRSWGYVERDEDLYITHGIMFRNLTAVPYGRMQFVEVESGPLQRAFGIASVSLVTASAATDATIPGLPPEEAARLRDRLTELGESRSSGL